MADETDDRPRDFRLSRSPSDLWLLFSAFAFGAVLIVAPSAVPWIFRALLVVAALVLLSAIRSVRRVADGRPRGWSTLDVVEALIGVGVLGVYVYVVGRVAVAGKWIDAALIGLLVAGFAYLQWLRSGDGPRRPVEPAEPAERGRPARRRDRKRRRRPA